MSEELTIDRKAWPEKLCDPDRPSTRWPFRSDDWYCCTNGHLVVAVPYTGQPVGVHEPGTIFARQGLETIHAECHCGDTHERECPDCNGTGGRCPECYNRGYVLRVRVLVAGDGGSRPDGEQVEAEAKTRAFFMWHCGLGA